MADLIYLAVLFAFFGVAALFVMGCDRIIGPDEAALREGLSTVPTPDADADAEPRKAAA
jgi:hypothetical protein